MAFMDLEKAYHRIERNTLRQVLKIYGTRQEYAFGDALAKLLRMACVLGPIDAGNKRPRPCRVLNAPAPTGYRQPDTYLQYLNILTASNTLIRP